MNNKPKIQHVACSSGKPCYTYSDKEGNIDMVDTMENSYKAYIADKEREQIEKERKQIERENEDRMERMFPQMSSGKYWPKKDYDFMYGDIPLSDVVLTKDMTREERGETFLNAIGRE